MSGPQAFLLLVATLLGAPETGAAAAPRGAVLITVDTLRADHVGFVSGRPEATPRIDAWARRGAVFSGALAPSPSTAPSHASIFTGRYPSFHGVGRSNGRFRLSGDEPVLAAILAERGVATAAVVSNAVLAVGLGLERGFDRYDDDLPDRELNRPQGERRAASAVARAREELSRLASQERFFFWLHLQDPHGPYTPPELWMPDVPAAPDEPRLPPGVDHSGYRAIPRYQQLGAEDRVAVYRAAYRGEVAYLDHELGALLEWLGSDPRFAETLVVFTSDHGEALGEEGFYFAHGHGVGPELTGVPLALVGPGVPPGVEIPGAVTTVALCATLLEHFGLPAPEGAQAGSLARWLAAPGGRADEPVYSESHNQIGIARGGSWLVRDRVASEAPGFWGRPNPDSGGFWKALPPRSSASAPQELAGLEELLARFERVADASDLRLGPRREGRQRQRSEAERERLRALGYLD